MTDDELWSQFHACTLPESAWTHRAHLRIAWLFLDRHTLDEAHVLMRVGIVRLNTAHGLVETVSRGYHETLTRVWLTLVAALRKADRAPTSAAFVDAHAPQLTNDAVRRHYTREHMMSTRARAMFVAPDCEPLPEP
jgi:hypothetical protein